MSSSNGLFVSIDGPSGVGKSTTARALAQLTRNEGRTAHLTRDPSTLGLTCQHPNPLARLLVDGPETTIRTVRPRRVGGAALRQGRGR
jgi:energy-coupling factor transporter ATP-binding protein EcfA2